MKIKTLLVLLLFSVATHAEPALESAILRSNTAFDVFDEACFQKGTGRSSGFPVLASLKSTPISEADMEKYLPNQKGTGSSFTVGADKITLVSSEKLCRVLVNNPMLRAC